MGVANSIAAVAAGARRIDCACGGMGAGAGNTPMEVFVAVANRMGIETGVDVFKISDVAEDLVTPILDFPVRIDRNSLRSEEHTSELQSLMRISYAVFCLKKKNK